MDAATHTEPLWADPRNPVHLLREMIARGLSAAETADELSRTLGRPVTRDSAKQKARTLGLRFRGKMGPKRRLPAPGPGASLAELRAHAREQKKSTGAGHNWRAIKTITLRPQPLPLHELRCIPARGETAPLENRSGCAWPVSDWLEPGTARTPFCNAAPDGDCPYCPDHRGIAYQPRAA